MAAYLEHSVDDTVASPGDQNAPRRWSIVCHTRCHSAAEEADLHARALVMAGVIFMRRAGLTGVRALMPDLSREGSLTSAISQAGTFARRYTESDLDAGVHEDAIFQERNEALASSLDPTWRQRLTARALYAWISFQRICRRLRAGMQEPRSRHVRVRLRLRPELPSGLR